MTSYVEGRSVVIERIKVVSIFFVIVGHLLARKDGYFPDEWHNYKDLIYTFHMPVFMIVSGYSMAASKSRYRGRFEYLKNRYYRLLRPALVLFFIVVFAKALLSDFVHVDNWRGTIASLRSIFLSSEESGVVFIWYLFALFYGAVIYAATNFSKEIYLFSIFFLVHVLVNAFDFYPDYFFFDRFLIHAVFLYLGCCMHRYSDQLHDVFLRLRVIVSSWVIFSSLLVIFLCLLKLSFGDDFRDWLFFNGVVFYLVALLVFSGAPRRCDAIGAKVVQYAMPIYLFNVLFIGLAKGLAILLGVIDYRFLSLVLMFFSGLLGSIFLSIFLRRYFPGLHRLLG